MLLVLADKDFPVGLAEDGLHAAVAEGLLGDGVGLGESVLAGDECEDDERP